MAGEDCVNAIIMRNNYPKTNGAIAINIERFEHIMSV